MKDVNEYISYGEEFEEMRCIGRGNFGAAFLVKLKHTPDGEDVFFIAKKIILGQLTEKEQEGAFLEVRKFSKYCFVQILIYVFNFRPTYCVNWTIQISYHISTRSRNKVCSSL